MYSDGKAAYNASLERTKHTKENFKYQKKCEEKKRKSRTTSIKGKKKVKNLKIKNKNKLFYRQEKKMKMDKMITWVNGIMERLD